MVQVFPGWGCLIENAICKELEIRSEVDFSKKYEFDPIGVER